jgi:hypothetical protein
MSNAIALTGAVAPHFISAAEAIRRHPTLNRAKLYRMGLTKQVRVQLLRGTPPRYSVIDLDHLLAATTAEGRQPAC